MINIDFCSFLRRKFISELGREAFDFIKRCSCRCWAVGGAVRDCFWKLPIKDWDIVIDGSDKDFNENFVRNFCSELKASFVMLDKERGIFTACGRGWSIDFCTRAGLSMLEDLSNRDFTINALAAECFNSDEILDTGSSLSDLQEKILRPVSESCMLSDPLRVIRGLRFLSLFSDFGLKADRSFFRQAELVRDRLKEPAPERIWSELCRILSQPADSWIKDSDVILEELCGPYSSEDKQKAYAFIKAFDEALLNAERLFKRSGQKLCDWFSLCIGRTGRKHVSLFRLCALCCLGNGGGFLRADSHKASAFNPGNLYYVLEPALSEAEKRFVCEVFALSQRFFELLSCGASNSQWHAFVKKSRFLPAAALAAVCIDSCASGSCLKGLKDDISKAENYAFCICRGFLDRADEIVCDYIEGGRISRPVLPVSGADIAFKLKASGPDIGRCLHYLAEQCSERDISQSEAWELLGAFIRQT